MAKNIRRMLAMVLVLCMFLSALPMQALAAEGESFEHDGLTVTITPSEGGGGSGSGSGGSSEGGSGGGSEGGSGGSSEGGSGGSSEGGSAGSSESGSSTSNVQVSGTSNSTGANVDMNGTKEVTTETTKDSSGNTTTNTETTVKLEGKVKEDNIEKDATWQETTQESSTTDAEGNEINSSTVVDGEETKEWTEDVKPGDEVPSVEVTVKPGDKNSNEETTEKLEKVDHVEGGSTETNSDETTITTKVEREVTVEAGEESVIITENKTVLESVAPENYDGKNNWSTSGVYAVDGKYWDRWIDENNITQSGHVGFDFQYTGVADIADEPFRVDLMTVTYKKDANGNPEKDENGNYIIESVKSINPATGSEHTSFENGYPTQVKMFVLTKYNEKGEKERYFTYCLDADTPTTTGSWYSISNLEDSDYYPDEESEDHLRAITTNGYWGTKEGLGSVKQIKENMLKDFDKDDTITITDNDGKEHTYNVVDMINSLCEGEALAATQAAIWSYSNGALGVQDGKDGVIVNDSFYYATISHKDFPAIVPERKAKMKIMYEWLMGLKQEKSSNASTVINEHNFVEEVSLAVGKKVDEVTVLNADDNTTSTNGIYETELNFTLAFVPAANDDLLVCLTYVDLDGNKQTVTKRLAGANKEGENYDPMNRNEDGSYTFTGLTLSENQKFDFDLNLEGTQYLEKGVYIYTAHGGVTESQTMVGIAEGTQSVNVTAHMSLKFSVDEEKAVQVKRHWHHEEDPSYDPPTPPAEHPPVTTNYEEPPTPQVFRLNHQDPDVEIIPEEPVPLATPAITGDDSGMWVAVILVSVLCMVAINIFDKKRQHETF